MKKYTVYLVTVFLVLFLAYSTGNAGKIFPLGSSDAAGIHYDNSTSGLSATNVKSAIDEAVTVDSANLSSTNISDALDELYGLIGSANTSGIDWAGLDALETTTGLDAGYLVWSTGGVTKKMTGENFLDWIQTDGGLAPDSAHYFTDQAESGLSGEVVVSANGKSLITAANYAAMRGLLDLEAGTDFNAYDAQLADVAGLTPTDNGVIIGDGSNFVVESGSTLRTSLGLAIGTNVQAYDYDLGSLSSGITGLVKGAGNGGGYSAAIASDLTTLIGSTTYQAYDADLTTYAGITPSANAQTLLGETFAQMLASIGAQATDADLTTLAAISGQRGDIIYYGASGWTRLAKGTENYILKMGASDPAWAENTAAGASAFDDLTDVAVSTADTGGIVYFNGTNWVPLAKGTEGQYLKTGTAPSWDTPSGAGDMLAASYPFLVALEGLTTADASIIQLTGTDAAAVLTSGGNNYILGSNSDNSALEFKTPANVLSQIGAQAADNDLTTYAGITPSANIQTFLGSANYAAMRTNMGVAVGSDVQAYDAELAALAGLTSAANAIPYFTGSGTAGVISSSANMVSLLGSADYATARTNLGLAIGTNVQAYDADLTSIAGGVTGIVKGAGNGGGFSAATAGTDYPGLASANTFTGNNVFGDGDADTLTIRSMIIGGNSRAVQIAASLASPTYATGTNELYVAGDIETTANIYAASIATTGASDHYISMGNNTSLEPSGNRLYFEGNALKVSENGTEKDVVMPSDSVTWTGTTHSFAGVTNMLLPTATPDAGGEIGILTTAHQLAWHDGNKVITIDSDADAAGYVLKSDGNGNFTPQADATAGSPTLDTVGDPAADSTIDMDAGEEVNFTYSGAFTTGSQFLIRQLTGNPSGGNLFEVRVADTDVTAAVIGDGTNTFNVSAGGNVSLSGTASITAGGVILGDSSPDATGEIGVSGGVLACYDTVSGNGFVPDAADGGALGSAALEFSDGFFADGAVLSFGNDQDVTLTHVADTGLLLNAAMQLQFRDSAIHIESANDGHLDLTADTSIDLNGAVAATSTVDIAGALALGTASSAAGSIVFHNASNAYHAIIQSGATSATYTLTLPTSLPATDGLVATCSSMGVMSWSAGGGTEGIASVAEDTTPQLGGDLDLNGHKIIGTVDDPYVYLDSISGTDIWFGLDTSASQVQLRYAETVGDSLIATWNTTGNMNVIGDLTVTGNDITFGNGETISNATDGTILLTAPTVSVSSALGVTGTLTANGAATIGDGGDLIVFQFDSTPASDSTGGGEYIAVVSTTGLNVAAGDILVVVGSSSDVPLVALADADVAAKVGMVLLATEAINAGATGKAMLRGVFRLDAWTWSGSNKSLYLSATAGDATETAPSTAAQYVQKLGYTMTDDSIYWNPSGDFILLK